MIKRNIAVIGAGTIGLSTAYNIQKNIQNVKVTVISEQFSPNTTSDIAAGFWRPHRVSNTPIEDVKRWSKETWDHLMGLVMSDVSSVTGTTLTSGRELFKEIKEDPFWKDTVFGYRRLSEEELKFYPDHFKFGYFYTTVIVDHTKYLPWLTKKFKAIGGEVKQKKIQNFNELTGYDVIVNCTGMGSRDLCGDATLQPIRGHVIRAQAPWVKHFTIAPDEKLHILCTINNISMGLTDREDSNPMLIEDDRNRILSGCAELEPSVSMATDLRDYLGFRPVRPTIRIEVEHKTVGAKNVPIVHNYGHGGSGITLHWGCAKEATRLVQKLVHNKSKL